MVAENQLIQFINCSQELKEKMKEEFYKQKIQEAKDKKGTPKFKWDELPEEVEEIIINYKEQMEYEGNNSYSIGGYIRQVIKENHLTQKSLSEYLFDEYKNEKGDGLRRLPNLGWNFEKFIWIMINKKSMLEHYYPRRLGSGNYPQTDKDFLRITENKTPSLEEYIVFRNKQRKKQSEERKAKNKAKDNDIESKFKIGDLVYLRDRWGSERTALIITGETKTQYRVEKVDWTYDGYRSDDNYTNYITYGLSTDKSTWVKSKHKNIGKKGLLRYLEKKTDHRCPTNDELYICGHSYSMFN
tara:strand:+ start:1005 stop:1901 length:897 start_codon:yes stop_codon:yes gene_type:complete